jgi:hypothetical protein
MIAILVITSGRLTVGRKEAEALEQRKQCPVVRRREAPVLEEQLGDLLRSLRVSELLKEVGNPTHRYRVGIG